MTRSTKDLLLDAAEARIRSSGYNGFSFRDLAEDLGIKSASVHYHFATKPDLVEGTVRRYTDTLLAALGDPREIVQRGDNPVVAFAKLYQASYLQSKSMCLCGVLAAERQQFSDKLKSAIDAFFEENLAWLLRALDAMNFDGDRRKKAIQLLSLFEGAQLVRNATDENFAFEDLIDL